MSEIPDLQERGDDASHIFYKPSRKSKLTPWTYQRNKEELIALTFCKELLAKIIMPDCPARPEPSLYLSWSMIQGIGSAWFSHPNPNHHGGSLGGRLNQHLRSSGIRVNVLTITETCPAFICIFPQPSSSEAHGCCSLWWILQPLSARRGGVVDAVLSLWPEYQRELTWPEICSQKASINFLTHFRRGKTTPHLGWKAFIFCKRIKA